MTRKSGTTEEIANPVPTGETPSATPDAGTQPEAAVPDSAAPDADAETPESGPVLRTIVTRSPLGQLDPDNLLRQCEHVPEVDEA